MIIFLACRIAFVAMFLFMSERFGWIILADADNLDWAEVMANILEKVGVFRLVKAEVAKPTVAAS